MMSNRAKWFGGVCAAACLAAGGVVAGAGAEDSTAPPAQPETADASAAPVRSVEPEQAREIGELRRSRNSDDALPSQWRNMLADPSRSDDQWGANPSLSRRTAPGVWIVPGDGYVCVANATPGEGALGFGCATPEDVDRGLLAPSDVDANGNGVLTGVVPDGVGHVTVVNRDGSTRESAVDNNTYRVAIDADLKEVRFTGSDGAERVLPMAWDR
jgi:hypothetical protein